MEVADETLLHLSVLTLGEIRKGLAGLPQGKRRTHLETWLEIELREFYWQNLADRCGRHR
jgi:toxin FitB